MAVLAVSAAWVGVVGTALGGLLGFMTSWLVHRSERAATIAARSREERKEAYAALLANAEDSLHLFEWLADRDVSANPSEEEKKKANYFYDQEVTPRYMVLKIIGAERVLGDARKLRQALNALRHLMVDADTLPTKKSPKFEAAHSRYRTARDQFIEAARADLDLGHEKRKTGQILGRLKHSPLSLFP